MARTRASNFDEKRDAIMNKAAELFAQKGFSGTSISDLSKTCEVSKSLIYHYYAVKEDILYGVMRTHIDELINVINDPNLTAATPTQEFTDLTLALLTCYAGEENAQKVLLYELNHLKAEQRKEIVTKQRHIITRFEDVYVRIHPKLSQDKAQLRARIMLFFGMVNWMHTWFNPNGDINRVQITDMIIRTITNSD